MKTKSLITYFAWVPLFVFVMIACASKKSQVQPPTDEQQVDEIEQASARDASACADPSLSRWEWISASANAAPPLFKVLDFSDCKLERVASNAVPKPIFSGSCRATSKQEVEVQGVLSELVAQADSPKVLVESNDRSYQNVFKIELIDSLTAEIDGQRYSRNKEKYCPVAPK